MNNDTIKIFNESMSLVKLLEQAQSNNPAEKTRAQQGLAEWLSYIPGYRDGEGNLLLPENADISKIVKDNMGVIYGRRLYGELPEFTAGTIDDLMKVDPTWAYMLSVPLLEKLGGYVGVGKIDGEDFNDTIEKINKGELNEDEAKKILREYAEKYLRPAFDNDARVDAEGVKELMEIYIGVWTEGSKSKTGRMLLNKQYRDLYIRPWMEKNKDKIIDYANNIKTTALANKKASSYEGYTEIKNYMLPVISSMEQIKQQYEQQSQNLQARGMAAA